MTSLCNNGGRTGFTLIELLVVVLIIGILAAVALPQYQKAVVRSQVMGIVALQKSIANAQRLYMLEHDTYPTSFDELNVALDSMKASTFNILNSANVVPTRYNDTFEINLYQTSNAFYLIQGPYKGCGMSVNVETGKWRCREWYHFYKGKPGGFCQEIMKSEPMSTSSNNVRHYPMKKLG